MPVKPNQLVLLSFPIQDKSVATDQVLEKIVNEVLTRIQRKEKIYVRLRKNSEFAASSQKKNSKQKQLHCKGGHGRTGVTVSCLISKLYNLDPYYSLQICSAYHDHRADIEEKPNVYSSPETHIQKDQVYRVINSWISKKIISINQDKQEEIVAALLNA